MSAGEKTEALNISVNSIESTIHLQTSDPYLLQLSLDDQFQPAEKILLANSHFIFEGLSSFDPPVQRIIKKWTIEMAQGMKKYAFGSDIQDSQLKKMTDLDEYIYYVAGTVGRLLTDLLSLDRFKISRKRQQILQDHCVAFGKGLQLVNIIKDSRSDKVEGRCYIPEDLLNRNDLDLSGFFDAGQKEKILPVYHSLIRQAEKYLKEAVTYIQTLPLSQFRYRLACIWTVELAYETLAGLKHDLETFIVNQRVFKISRKAVKRILYTSVPGSVSNRYFARQVFRLQRKCQALY
jgi:farnesyl-diphosphate farnesyltransferase